MLPWPGLCALALEMFLGESLSSGPASALAFLIFFETVLLQALVHLRCLSLYQQILETLVLFRAFLLHVLVHPLSHPSLYQQTLETLVFFRGSLTAGLSTTVYSFCELSTGSFPSFLSALPYHCMQIALQDLL